MARSKAPILLPAAKRDVKNGFDWYEEQKPGLGDILLGRVEECLSAIQRSPRAFQPVGKDARRAIVKQFPYAIFYRIEEEIIYIYSVFHTSQDPQKWMERLEDVP
jgi:plasmid stabilization system protein ParE